MRFGMLHLFENPIEKSEHEIIHEQLELGKSPSQVAINWIRQRRIDRPL